MWGSILSVQRQYRKYLHLFSHLHLCVLITETSTLLTGSKTGKNHAKVSPTGHRIGLHADDPVGHSWFIELVSGTLIVIITEHNIDYYYHYYIIYNNINYSTFIFTIRSVLLRGKKTIKELNWADKRATPGRMYTPYS